MKKIICILLVITMVIPFGINAADVDYTDQIPFADVKESHWYYEAISYCYENGLLNGMSETRFGVNEKVTREMFVQALANFADIDRSEYENSESPFTDTVQGQWYYAAVEWARQNEIVSGMSETSFGVKKNLTREQMARLFCQYAKYMNKDISEKADYSDFTDVDKISDWATEGMNYAVAKSFIVGDGGEVKPGANATRAQLAVVLMKFHRFYSRRIVCWGDSLTMGVIDYNYNLVDRPYPQTIEDITGFETVNYGVGGDTSEQIGMRQGGVRVEVYADEDETVTIPAECEAIRVLLLYEDVEGGLTNASIGIHGMRGVNPVTIAGVEGTLELENNIYYFTRSEAGEEVTFDSSVTLETFAMKDRRDTDINVLYIGNNNEYQDYDNDYARLIDIHQRMIAQSGNENYVIVGFTAPIRYLPGGHGFNARLKVTYGDKFVNPKDQLTDPEYLRSRGVEVTQEDLDQIAKNDVPPCMIHKEDGNKLHGSQLYYDIVGEEVAAKILEIYG